jgi:hypothetical protein
MSFLFLFLGCGLTHFLADGGDGLLFRVAGEKRQNRSCEAGWLARVDFRRAGSRTIAAERSATVKELLISCLVFFTYEAGYYFFSSPA